MRAAFGSECDGGSPFNAVAVVVGELQEDFGVAHRHGLAGGSLSASISTSVNQRVTVRDDLQNILANGQAHRIDLFGDF
jgi:hypothetical protein